MASDAHSDPRPEVAAAAAQAQPSSTAPLDRAEAERSRRGSDMDGAQPRNPGAAQASTGPRLLATLREALDRLLVADVFLVLAGALWFVVAVLLHSRGVEAPLRLFQKLWQPLFTPAIGLLMAAALVSGLLGWWQRRGPGAVRGTGS